jgi:hypothetical protein
VGCPGSLQNPERFEGGVGPGECDAEMILVQSCGTNPVCHDADTPQAGLDMASPDVASRLIDVAPSLCAMENVYIDSADPSASFLLAKINPSPGCGEQMPPASSGETPLTAEEIQCITDWVNDITGGSGGDAGMDDGGAMDAAADASDDGAMP